ncbi:polysaccharide biosynthesis tyrosine autokinase [Gryllotalpicola reticulitermitis]|uniref:Polysaccharide biosynthesis tyrosine autokinase n=1 Tax=Gryllotalpicola reticulitermitis TaxID=1184153 RepID=A0ABV8Q7C9_9MICO
MVESAAPDLHYAALRTGSGRIVTFKQLIGILWSRRWLIIIMVVAAFAVAAAYLKLTVPSYSSTEIVRESSTVTTAAQSGQIGSVEVDFDPSTITTEKVLGPAATSLGLPAGALLGSVKYAVTNGTQTNTIDISGTAASPAAAQERTARVVSQYNSYLQKQIQSAESALESSQAAASATAVKYQKQVSGDAGNSVAQTNLTSALTNLGGITQQLQAVQNAGTPLTIMTAAQPGGQVGPSKLTILMLALVCGLIAGAGIALIRDQFDNRLRGDHELEGLTGLRSLGELGYDRQVARAKDLLPAAGVRGTALLESVRAVRTSAQMLLPREHAVVVVTSAQPSDGKTFVSANLALSLARAGKNVILVEGDLRRATLGRFFEDAATGTGLSGLLEKALDEGAVNEHDITSVLQATPYPELRVLPAGAPPAAAGDLLAAPELGDIIGHLRAMADVVVIDSPPALTVVDATLLAKHADGALLVAAIGRVDRDRVAAAADVLGQNGVTVLGTVANRSRRNVPRPYAAYYAKSVSHSHSHSAA